MNLLICSVMAVKFVRTTHYMFSVGKDRLVKYWDADKFELLLTLEGHHAEVWCLTISNRGDFIVTGSHDQSIRRWDRTEEPFFIEVFLTGICSLKIIATCAMLTSLTCSFAILTYSSLLCYRN